MTPFQRAVLDAVDTIPVGRVSTYADVAALAGRPRAARSVGGTLAAYGDEVPWHRVVRSDGSFPWAHRQASRLRDDGVSVTDDGPVDLQTYGWDGPADGR